MCMSGSKKETAALVKRMKRNKTKSVIAFKEVSAADRLSPMYADSDLVFKKGNVVVAKGPKRSLNRKRFDLHAKQPDGRDDDVVYGIHVAFAERHVTDLCPRRHEVIKVRVHLDDLIAVSHNGTRAVFRKVKVIS